MIAKGIRFFGASCVLICDGKCKKAWGINHRPRTMLSDDVDDHVYIADSQLGDAPDDPGTYEGGDAKPLFKAARLNKWCARECERGQVVDDMEEFTPRDLEHPEPNIPRNPATGGKS
jgi:hypothetical protein